jgi:hypothetical protein
MTFFSKIWNCYIKRDHDIRDLVITRKPKIFYCERCGIGLIAWMDSDGNYHCDKGYEF